MFYKGKWASRADSIIFYKEFARPERQENPGQCGQNLRKTMIFVFFLRELGKCIVAMLSVQRPQLGAEKVVRKR